MLLDALLRRYYLARDPLLVKPAVDQTGTGTTRAAGLGLAKDEAPYLAYDATVATEQRPAADAVARFDWTFQVVAINGAAEALAVQASLDGVNFFAVALTPVAGGAAVTSVTAAGMWTFSGVFAFVQVARSAGAKGTTTKAYVAGQAR